MYSVCFIVLIAHSSGKVNILTESSIVKLAITTRRVILLVTFLGIIGSIFLWFMATIISPDWIDASFPVEIQIPMSIERSLLGFIPAMLPVALFAFIFGTLAQLFNLYANQHIFEKQNSVLIKRIGVLLTLTPLITIISDITLSLALTYSQGVWNIDIHPSDSDFTNFTIGLVVICIGKVMDLAVQQNEEIKLTI